MKASTSGVGGEERKDGRCVTSLLSRSFPSKSPFLSGELLSQDSYYIQGHRDVAQCLAATVLSSNLILLERVNTCRQHLEPGP